MSVYIIQDKFENENLYAASRPTLEEARKLLKEVEGFDEEIGEYIPDRYRIREREYCFSDYSEACGNCAGGICMLETPGKECPLVKLAERAEMETGGYTVDPVLAPGAWKGSGWHEGIR